MEYFQWAVNAFAAIGGIYTVAKTTSYISRFREPYRNVIANLHLEGPIVNDDYKSKLTGIIKPLPISNTIDSILKRKNRYGENNVKGIIFSINSPGGFMQPSVDISKHISKMELPVIAYVANLAASGGYMIASACNKIVAKEFSSIGSIGVLSPHVNIKKLTDRLGIEDETVKSGDYKDMGSIFRSFNDNERKHIQGELDELYNFFVDWIADKRKLEKTKVLEIANGLTYLGTEALKLGLVNSIGDFNDAVKTIEELGCFKNDFIANYYFPNTPGPRFPFSIFFSSAYEIGDAFGEGISHGISKGLLDNKFRNSLK